jgi:ABC-type multidrug transport system, permease component
MRSFISFIRKEFYHIFRDRRTVLILLVMPVIQIILFGFAITTEVRNNPIAVLDLSNDVLTRRIIERLQSGEYFNIREKLTSSRDIDRVFKEGKIKLIVVFEENFENNLVHTGTASVRLLTDATDPNQGVLIAGYASNIIQSGREEMLEGNAIPFRINSEIKMLYNPQLKSAYNFVPGIMGLILMLICAMMTSISIVREKETGTMEVLLVSPVKPIQIILAKAVPYFVLSIINLITILLLSYFVLEVPIAGSLLSLLLLSLLFIAVALAFGLLISSVVKTQVAAMLLSGMGLIMPMILLSGMIYPIESMPPVLQYFSCIIPARWYIEGVRKLMIQGVDFIYVIKEIGIIFGMALLLIGISLNKFQLRLN